MGRTALVTLTGNVFEEELGIAILASQLRGFGYEVDIYHFYDKDHAKISDTLFSQNYSVVCFNSFHSNINDIAIISTKLKEMCEIPIVIGGCFASDSYEFILSKYDCVDYIIIGEAENIICEMISYIIDGTGNLEDIAGIAYVKQGSVITNKKCPPVKDLDVIPFGSRDIAAKYKLSSVYIEASRGCSGMCTFCACNRVEYRQKSIDRIVEEIEHVIENYNIDTFSFTDCSWDNPDNSLDRITELCNIVDDRKIPAHFFMFLKSPISRIASDDFFNMISKTGVFSVFVGLESFVQDELNMFAKKCNVNDNINVMEMLNRHKYNLHTQVGIIFFHPYSTIENMQTNNFFMHKFGKALQFQQCNTLEVYNNTPMQKNLIKDGLYKPQGVNFTDYSFMDNRVSPLFKFVSDNFMNSGVNRKIFDMNSYFRNHYSYLIIQKHKYNRLGSCEGQEIIKTHLDKMFSLANQVNDLSYKVFDKLLYIAQCGWDQKEAANTIASLLCEEALNEIISSTQLNRKKLLKNIKKIRS